MNINVNDERGREGGGCEKKIGRWTEEAETVACSHKLKKTTNKWGIVHARKWGRKRKVKKKSKKDNEYVAG